MKKETEQEVYVGSKRGEHVLVKFAENPASERFIRMRFVRRIAEGQLNEQVEVQYKGGERTFVKPNHVYTLR